VQLIANQQHFMNLIHTTVVPKTRGQQQEEEDLIFSSPQNATPADEDEEDGEGQLRENCFSICRRFGCLLFVVC
jgi:hypothetical protein